MERRKDRVKEIKMKEMEQRNRLAKEYDKFISDYQHKVEIASAIEEINPKEGEYILDAGCGTGRITYRLVEAGCNVVGVDFSKESLKVCRQRCSALNKGNLHLIIADVCNLPLKDCSFDKCISTEVFEQIPTEEERLKMLHELHRVLKPGGKLILTTYNYSLRKIIGRKRETFSGELYFYRYDYFKLKHTISTVFDGKIKIIGILNLIHWLPVNMLNKFEKFLIPIDKFIEKTPFSYLLAHLLCVKCEKICANCGNNGDFDRDKNTKELPKEKQRGKETER